MPVQYSRTLLSIASNDWTECVEGREERGLEWRMKKRDHGRESMGHRFLLVVYMLVCKVDGWVLSSVC